MAPAEAFGRFREDDGVGSEPVAEVERVREEVPVVQDSCVILFAFGLAVALGIMWFLGDYNSRHK